MAKRTPRMMLSRNPTSDTPRMMPSHRDPKNVVKLTENAKGDPKTVVKPTENTERDSKTVVKLTDEDDDFELRVNLSGTPDEWPLRRTRHEEDLREPSAKLWNGYTLVERWENEATVYEYCVRTNTIFPQYYPNR
uniref:Uncharacterized protein n=1 Tax=Hyaloperonospora arabidopsidis (strain Emoy2) TaxID=559515 RepID=M4C4M9_HYAAE